MEDSPTPLAEILALLRGPAAERLCLLGNCGRVRPPVPTRQPSLRRNQRLVAALFIVLTYSWSQSLLPAPWRC
jgi:hypothetical protein